MPIEHGGLEHLKRFYKKALAGSVLGQDERYLFWTRRKLITRIID
jgi:hypothetical protein